MNDLIGQSLGRYRILEQLGEGGMATVYKAYDTRLETDVAVKVIRTENLTPNVLERALKRFEREAKALARLTHPNIVKVTDYGEYEGKPYLVMPYLPGGTLKRKLGKPIPWKEGVPILLPIVDALDYAHSQNMIHRDVKPSNILLTQRGQPMLTDFGIAKILLATEETADLTGTGMGVGTPEYMSSEQFQGRGVDARTDVYSLGVVFYEMITGRKPYEADTPPAIMLKQAMDPLPRPRSFVPDLPQAVENVLLKALAKKPEDRYQSMAEMAAALENLIRGVVGKTTKGTSALQEKKVPVEDLGPEGKSTASRLQKRLPNWWERIPGRMKVAGIGSLLLVVGVFILVLMSKGNPTPPMRPLEPISTPIIYTSLQFTPELSPYLYGRETPINTLVPPTMIPTKVLTPTLLLSSAEITDVKSVTMHLIPAGEFTMGSDNGNPDEKPAHQVYLNAYYMDKFLVTNALYKACVDTGVCNPPHATGTYTYMSYYGNSQYDNYPVVYVDWNQANAYCKWRGARLPTEAEWEKAARGTDGRVYPWGNGSPNRNLLNYNFFVGDTTEVSAYPAGVSPYGIYDMAGNVWEWVADWYDNGYYANSPSSNPPGPSSGNVRVRRGGSWDNDDFNVRSANRGGKDPPNTNILVGFRCSRSLP